MKKIVEIEVDTGKCGQCHFKGIDGGPGPVACCNHPDAPDYGYIISWNKERTEQVSDKCPLQYIKEGRNVESVAGCETTESTSAPKIGR